MPNGVRFTTDEEPRALRSGNMRIDVGGQIGGPTYKTQFYAGITPPNGGYTFYEDKKGPIIEDNLVYAIDAENYTSYRTDLALNEVWDLSGNLKTGTLINGPTYNSDGGGCFIFDGASTYIDVADTLSDFSFIQNTGVYTITVWVRNNFPTTPMTILGNNSQLTTAKGFYMGTDSAGNIGMFITRGASGQFVGEHKEIMFSNTNWTCITAVGNGTGNTFYKNGVQVGSIDNFSTFSTGDSSSNLGIGRANDAEVNFWDGKISTVLIYSDTQSAAEVLQNYNATKGKFGL